MLNSIKLSDYVWLYSYLTIVIMLPLQIKPTYLILLSAFAGAITDIIAGTSGLLTATLVWIAFIRPVIVKLTISADLLSSGGFPFSSRIGTGKFLRYVFISSLLFGAAYTALEVMSLNNILFQTIRVVISAAANTLLIFLLQLPFGPRK